MRNPKGKERSEYQDRGGHFFEYLIKPDTPRVLVNYLKRLQIFETLTNDNGNERTELKDCCFVYALNTTGLFDEDM